jgi:3-oxoacyl-[acyl-carrier-protein] synthase-3
MKRTWTNVRLLSWATELPDEVLSSEELEERLSGLLARAGIERGVLAAKTGVLERRLYAADVDPEPVAARVALQALTRSGLTGRDVGAVYSASIDHRYFEPSAAHFVAQAMGGAPRAQLLDVRDACLGFIDAVSLAADRIDAGAIDVAVIVAAEAGGMRRTIETSIATALVRGELAPEDWVPLTMGCGAVAWVLGTASRFAGAASINAFLTHNMAEHTMACSGRIGDDGALRVNANGAAILRHGAPLVVGALRAAQDELGVPVGQVFLHQVGSAFTSAISRKLGLTVDERTLVFPRLGNTGPVGLPFALARAADAGWLTPGTSLSLLGGASGLSAAYLGLTWRGAAS